MKVFQCFNVEIVDRVNLIKQYSVAFVDLINLCVYHLFILPTMQYIMNLINIANNTLKSLFNFVKSINPKPSLCLNF